MKYTEVQFTLGDAEHTLRAECDVKFMGANLELSLDGLSLTTVRGVKKFSFYTLPLGETTLTVFVALSDRGAPSLELIADGVALSSGKSAEEYLAEREAKAKKKGRLAALRNAVLYFTLFAIAGMLVGILRTGGEFSLRTLLIGVVCGAVVTAIFLVWDLLDLRSDLKSLREGKENPTALSPEEASALAAEASETNVSDDAAPTTEGTEAGAAPAPEQAEPSPSSGTPAPDAPAPDGAEQVSTAQPETARTEPPQEETAQPEPPRNEATQGEPDRAEPIPPAPQDSAPSAPAPEDAAPAGDPPTKA